MSSGPQLVVHPPLRTRMNSPVTGAALEFVHRRLRLKPSPPGTEVWIIVEPSAAIRSRLRGGPMSPDVASATTS